MAEKEQPTAVHSLAELTDRLGTAGIGLAEILDSLAEAVTIRAPDHQIIFANRAAIEHMHFDSLEDLIRAGTTSIMADQCTGYPSAGAVAMTARSSSGKWHAAT